MSRHGALSLLSFFSGRLGDVGRVDIDSRRLKDTVSTSLNDIRLGVLIMHAAEVTLQAG